VSGVLECTYLPHDSFLVVAYNVTKKNTTPRPWRAPDIQASCPLRASRTRMLTLCWARARGQVDPRALLALEGVRGALAAPPHARVAPDLHPGARAALMRRSAAQGAERVVLHALVLSCPAAVPCRSIPASGTQAAVHARAPAEARGAASCGQSALGALPPDEGAAQLERWRAELAALVPPLLLPVLIGHASSLIPY
jgi:hypothetical protein